MATRKTATSVGVTIETRDAIASESLQLGAQLGKRVSIGDVIHAALTVALRHRAELVKELQGRKGGTS